MRAWPASIPIRVRLALGFAAVMAVVLAGIGTFVYLRTRTDLDAQIERELAARTAGVIAIVRDDGDDLGDPVQDPLGRVDPEGAVQVLGPDGRVVDATATALLGERLLDGDQVRAIRDGTATSFDVDGPLGPLRVIATWARDDGVRYTILSAAFLEERDQALRSLSRLLLIGGPLALLVASLSAYAVATAALRPVERMRSRAARISSDDPGERLPVGPAEDEIAQLGRTLNAMLARLQGAIERERQFVADASHELRTPLTVMKAEIELALAAGRSPEELRKALLSSAEEAERLSGLADDLLVLARADDGRLPVERVPFDLAGLVADVVAARREIAGDREIRVEAPARLPVAADPLRIEQVLSNLIDNALRYGAGTVTVSARSEAGDAVIVVGDEGAGFAADLLGTATERFVRSSDGGAGLGLAIVESIASAHGGSVAVENDARGACVTVRLPLGDS